MTRLNKKIVSDFQIPIAALPKKPKCAFQIIVYYFSLSIIISLMKTRAWENLRRWKNGQPYISIIVGIVIIIIYCGELPSCILGKFFKLVPDAWRVPETPRALLECLKVWLLLTLRTAVLGQITHPGKKSLWHFDDYQIIIIDTPSISILSRSSGKLGEEK